MLEATFEIVSGLAEWGKIDGNIENQTDLYTILTDLYSQIGDIKTALHTINSGSNL